MASSPTPPISASTKREISSNNENRSRQAGRTARRYGRPNTTNPNTKPVQLVVFLCVLAAFRRIKANIHPIYEQERKALFSAVSSLFDFHKEKVFVLDIMLSHFFVLQRCSCLTARERSRYSSSNSRSNSWTKSMAVFSSHSLVMMAGPR